MGTGHVAFGGKHQAGILTPAPSSALIAAFDVVATDTPELAGALRDLTAAARWLTGGGPAPKRDPLLPPSDNLILGPDPDPSNLTVTVGVGASLFDERFGLAARKPKQLRSMEHFPHDEIDPERTHGDLLLQLCADSPDACVHALRILIRATRGTLVLRWMLPGFLRPNTLGHGRTSTRNLLGFKDGTANPDGSDPALMDRLVWVPSSGSGEPAWTAGGSYMVVRIIRTKVEFWDRTALATQEDIIGRRKASGAPLDGRREHDVPDYGTDARAARSLRPTRTSAWPTRTPARRRPRGSSVAASTIPTDSRRTVSSSRDSCSSASSGTSTGASSRCRSGSTASRSKSTSSRSAVASSSRSPGSGTTAIGSVPGCSAEAVPDPVCDPSAVGPMRRRRVVRPMTGALDDAAWIGPTQRKRLEDALAEVIAGARAKVTVERYRKLVDAAVTGIDGGFGID